MNVFTYLDPMVYFGAGSFAGAFIMAAVVYWVAEGKGYQAGVEKAHAHIERVYGVQISRMPEKNSKKIETSTEKIKIVTDESVVEEQEIAV